MRIVLKESVNKGKVNVLSQELGWSFEDDQDVNGLKEYLFVDYAKNTSILFVLDSIINMKYFLIKGDQEKEVLKDVIRCKNIVEYYSEEEIKTQYEDQKLDLSERIQAVYAYSLSLIDFNNKSYSMIRSMLFNEQEKIREAAIIGVGYVGWPELKLELDIISKNDASLEIRRKAATMSRGFSKNSEQ